MMASKASARCWRSVAVRFIPFAFGIFVFAKNSPYDYWYYSAALACLVAVIINCLSCINYFNYLTTRPVPNFFRREGANNAK